MEKIQELNEENAYIKNVYFGFENMLPTKLKNNLNNVKNKNQKKKKSKNKSKSKGKKLINKPTKIDEQNDVIYEPSPEKEEKKEKNKKKSKKSSKPKIIQKEKTREIEENNNLDNKENENKENLSVNNNENLSENSSKNSNEKNENNNLNENNIINDSNKEYYKPLSEEPDTLNEDDDFIEVKEEEKKIEINEINDNKDNQNVNIDDFEFVDDDKKDSIKVENKNIKRERSPIKNPEKIKQAMKSINIKPPEWAKNLSDEDFMFRVKTYLRNKKNK